MVSQESRQGVALKGPRHDPSSRGPWNEGENRLGEEWQYVENPIEHVRQSKGMLDHQPAGTPMSMRDMENKNKEMSKQKSAQAKAGVPKGKNQWSAYPQEELDSPTEVDG